MPNKEIELGFPRKDGQLSIMFNKGGNRPGAGRKRLGITKKTSLTLPEETWAQLNLLCKENELSQSEALRMIIAQYFNR